MRSKKLSLAILITFSILLGSGCASSVRFNYAVPSMRYNQPYAVITETQTHSGYVSSQIKGFYTSGTDYKELEEPANIESTSGTIAKGIYSITPYGLITHAIHHKKGRMIRVPAEKIGICIEYYYYKELSRTFSHSDSQYNYYWITYESSKWENTIWETVNAGEKYNLDLMDKELYLSKKKKHETAPSEAPVPPQDIEIKTEEIAENPSENKSDEPQSFGGTTPEQNKGNSENVKDIDIDNQEIIDAGVKKAKELGLNPIPMCEGADGNKYIPAGFVFNISNGDFALENGDMLINATRGTITAINVTLLRGEYAVIENDTARKGDGNLVSK